MKFVATEDISAPLDHVWACVTDFDRFEDMAAKRAQRLERQPRGPVVQGTIWTARATISGKKRDVRIEVTELAANKVLRAEGGTDGMAVHIEALLEARANGVTRLTVVTEAKARTLAARLLLQSAKLARGTLTKRYKKRVADFAVRVEGELVA